VLVGGCLGLFAGLLQAEVPAGATTTSTVSPLLAAGGASALYAEPGGSLLAWGRDGYGQLGNATHGYGSATPVSVSGVSNLSGLAEGSYSSLALSSTGAVYAWGENSFGILGATTPTYSDVPVEVPGLSGVSAIAAGQAFGVALESNGSVWAWGQNTLGQLGNGTTSNDATPEQVSGLPSIKAIAAGADFAIALSQAGQVYAWGYGMDGELGNGTTPLDSPSPVEVSGLSGVNAIAAGGTHALALRNGNVYAWGDNAYGQLGNATTTSSSIPVQVTSLANVTEIAAGSEHSLAVSSGSVYAWGENSSGQLGNATTTSSSTPVSVSGPSGVMGLAASSADSYAVGSDGTLWAWGDNTYGQLGDASSSGSDVPVEVVIAAPITTPSLDLPLSPAAPSAPHATAGDAEATVTWQAVPPLGKFPIVAYIVTASPGGAQRSVGGTSTSATLPSLTNGTSYTFSVTAVSSIRSSTTSPQSNAVTPAAPPGSPTNVSASAAGPTSARVSWSPPGDDGGMPVTTYTVSAFPGGQTTTVDAPTSSATVTGLQNGQGYTFSVTASNTTQSDPGAGGTSPPSAQSNGVVLSYVATAVSTGANFGLVLRSDGSVYGWGSDGSDELGVGNAASSSCAGGNSYCNPTPAKIPGLSGIVAISAGGTNAVSASGSGDSGFALALESNGNVYAWGSDGSGELGPGAVVDPLGCDCASSPVQVTGLTGVSAISAGGFLGGGSFALAVGAAGTVWAWGSNAFGQLGVSPSAVSSNAVPTEVAGLAGISVSAVSAGNYFALALGANGDAYAWGDNSYGELANGTTTGVNSCGGYCNPTPAPVSGISGVSAIAAGQESAFALESDGTAYAWGDNTFGELGNGTTTGPACGGGCNPTPEPVSDLTDTSAIAGGGSAGVGFGLALESNGTAYAWGDNSHGELGNGTTTGSACGGTTSGYVCDPTPAAIEWVPGVPQGVTASPGDSSVKLTWSPPVSSGGTTITAYTITTYPGAATTIVPGTATTATLSGLTNGDAYRFTVSATNAVGEGMTSAPTPPVMPSPTKAFTYALPAATAPNSGPNAWETAHFQPVCAGSSWCNRVYSHGGAPEVTPEVYLIFWGGDTPTTGYAATQLIMRLPGSAYQDILSQYGAGNPTLAGTFIDNNAPPSSITWADVGAEVGYAIGVNGWPTNNLNNSQYIVMLAPGYGGDAASLLYDATPSACAAHNAVVNGGNTYALSLIPWPGDAPFNNGCLPYQGNSDQVAAAFTTIISHEYAETATDPNPFTGWFLNGPDSQAYEIGDLCAYGGIPALGGAIWVQYLWDNVSQSCVAGVDQSYTYSYTSEVSPNGGQPMGLGSTFPANVEITNTGNFPWAVGGVVRLGTSNPRNRCSILANTSWAQGSPGCYNRVFISENVTDGNTWEPVRPGQVALFSFSFTVPNYAPGGIHYEYFDPVAEGITWMSTDAIYLVANVGYYAATFAGENTNQNPPSATWSTLPGLELHSATAEFVNTGNVPWAAFQNFTLGVESSPGAHDGPASPLYDGSSSEAAELDSEPAGAWPNEGRYAVLTSTTFPGGSYNFTFDFVAPVVVTPKTYYAYFTPVVEGLEWLSTGGHYFVINDS
jgi:alpha-tubulin suppressor-like RCC1 family protein